ncbi:MAG TPA: homoserine dehydrogenase, partial [Cellvibrio sp.]
MNPVRIGICGLGTVGSGTVNILSRNKALIDARAGCNISIVQIGARRDNPNCDTSKYNVTRDVFDVANNPDVDVLVEVMGGTTIAKDLILKAIENSKHI